MAHFLTNHELDMMDRASAHTVKASQTQGKSSFAPTLSALYIAQAFLNRVVASVEQREKEEY